MTDLTQIIKGCLQGNRQSQRALFDLYNNKLKSVALNYMRDTYEAQEALQESWIQIFNSLHQYKDQGNLEAWLKVILIRVCWKNIRKGKDTVSMDNYFEQNQNVHASQLYDKMTCEELLGMLSIIPAASRTVFTLFVVDQYSHNEIADLLNIKASTSRAHLTKARKLLSEKYFRINQITKNGS